MATRTIPTSTAVMSPAVVWPRSVLRQILPPPRSAVTLLGTLPMVGFLVVFLLTCFLLDSYGVLMFSSPPAFWLLVAVPWIWWMYVAGYSGLTAGRSVLALLVRLVLFGMFVMLLAQPRAVRKHDAMSVVFAVEISAPPTRSSTLLLTTWRK